MFHESNISSKNRDEWVKSSEVTLSYTWKEKCLDCSGTFVASLVRNFHHFHNLFWMRRDGLNAATPVKLSCQWKEWEEKGTLAARSQHSVHLEVSSHPFPHVIKLLSCCCLFLCASAQVSAPPSGALGFSLSPACFSSSPQLWILSPVTATVTEDYDRGFYICWFYCSLLILR